MDQIFNFLLSFLFDLSKMIINFVTAPLMLLLRQLIPNVNGLLQNANSFINTYILNGLHFAIMSFRNVANLSVGVWGFFVITLGIILQLGVSIFVIKAVFNIWSITTGNGDTK